MKPETCLMPKCKTSHVRISYSPNIAQRVSFISISFARDFLFNIGFPPDASTSNQKFNKITSKNNIFFGYNYQLFQIVFVEWRK